MRRLLLAAAIFGTGACAHAADMSDFLRGSFSAPSTGRNWDGWYVGGQVGYTSSGVDLSTATQSLTNFMLRNTVIQAPVQVWSLLSKNHMQGTGFGGFAGRNYQWEDIVVGVEANYNYLDSLSTSSSNSMSRRINNPAGQILPPNHTDQWDVTLTGAAAVQIKDVMTFRGRIGWATGNFLPYVFGGLAVGRLAVSRSATVQATETDVFNGTDPNTGLPIQTSTVIGGINLTQAEVRGNNFTAGYTGGLGTEMMLFSNVFARVEWEYVKFVAVKNMTVDMNSARVGIGYKF